VATNLDDLVVLTVFFAATRRDGLRRSQVVAGQYAGIATLVAVSAVAALGLLVVPDRWIGLLGLLPLALGVRGLVHARQADHPEPSVAAVTGWLGVAGVTVANGADNLSVYTPLFRQAGPGGIAVYAVVFAVLVALWCAAGAFLSGRRPVVVVLDRVGHWLVPVVFVALGVAILVTSGLLTR
jgi:cadmium resistance protein CadD (predicted permease)